uniref:Uncharacterized protein n=1 Tax=Tanacetum cinerariifolium TaxID=118510 RepID=A0A699I6X1_TANCI|nr:hypothetical protein [Tanacetum cinerariifolium]
MERLNEENQAKIKEIYQVTYTSEHSRRFNSICYDDDEEHTIPLSDIISQLSPSIVITTSLHVLPIEDLEDSLIKGNEDFNTILEKESDEFIKSSVEDLVPIPSESEDTSRSDSECVLPSCDDFSPINVFKENPDVNPLFDEVFENIESKDSYDSILDEPDLLVTPLSDANEDKCFNPRGDFDKIDAFLDIDTSTDVKDGYHDSGGDIIYLESLLTSETISSHPSEVFLDHDTKSLKDESVIDDSKNMVKIFDPEIHEKFFSPTYVILPFTDRRYIFFTYVVQILLLYFTYLVVSPFLFSFGSEDTIFDSGIFAFHFSHRSGTFISFNVYPNLFNESPMEICSSTCFTPNITMIWGESS